MLFTYIVKNLENEIEFKTDSLKEAVAQAESFAETGFTALIYQSALVERVWKCQNTGKIRSGDLADWKKPEILKD